MTRYVPFNNLDYQQLSHTKATTELILNQLKKLNGDIFKNITCIHCSSLDCRLFKRFVTIDAKICPTLLPGINPFNSRWIVNYEMKFQIPIGATPSLG